MALDEEPRESFLSREHSGYKMSQSTGAALCTSFLASFSKSMQVVLWVFSSEG